MILNLVGPICSMCASQNDAPFRTAYDCNINAKVIICSKKCLANYYWIIQRNSDIEYKKKNQQNRNIFMAALDLSEG